jgi:hypothetical protein
MEFSAKIQKKEEIRKKDEDLFRIFAHDLTPKPYHFTLSSPL